MRYLFDTNTCSYVINQRQGFQSIARRMNGQRYGNLVLSSIVLAELQFMVVKSAVPQAKREQLLRFLLQFHVAPFDELATLAYGQVRHQLERRGSPIGPLDTLIAAHAVSLKATVVTNNTRHFGQVSGLDVENWYLDPRAES
ncbi:MAG TPA: type II toxin-antitoxin system VapC family toxin [Burkholderiales bacterium]|nr:type II toxin-antitoxin system VapC family toxin [Burkholderiales bacterium]